MWPLLPVLASAPFPSSGELERAADPGRLPGCHRLELAVDFRMGLGVLGSDAERSLVQGELSDGLWRDLRVIQHDGGREGVNFSVDAAERSTPFFPPLVGRLPRPDGTEAGLAEELLGAFRRPGELISISPDDEEGAPVWRMDRAIYVQNPERGRQREVMISALLSRDPLKLRRWEATLDKGLALETGRLQRAHSLISFDEAGLPTEESLRATFRLGVFRLKVDQEIRYRSLGACSEGAPAGAPQGATTPP